MGVHQMEEEGCRVLFCDILIAEFYDIRVKRSKSRSCLHDKTFELGTRQT